MSDRFEQVTMDWARDKGRPFVGLVACRGKDCTPRDDDFSVNFETNNGNDWGCDTCGYGAEDPSIEVNFSTYGNCGQLHYYTINVDGDLPSLLRSIIEFEDAQ